MPRIDAELSKHGSAASPSFVAANAVPIARDDAFTTSVNKPISDTLATNDVPSTDGGNVWTVVSQPQNGTVVVNADGTFTYTPNTGFTGQDHFPYKITDINGDSSTAIATITILGVPCPRCAAIGNPLPCVGYAAAPHPYFFLFLTSLWYP